MNMFSLKLRWWTPGWSLIGLMHKQQSGSHHGRVHSHQSEAIVCFSRVAQYILKTTQSVFQQNSLENGLKFIVEQPLCYNVFYLMAIADLSLLISHQIKRQRLLLWSEMNYDTLQGVTL